MQDLFGSVRRSLVFNKSISNENDTVFSGFVEKINSSIRKSRIGLFPKSLPCKKDDAPPFRWRRGELIGCGAFGRVHMGMNLDSGELLAVKQVLIAASSASKEKTQAHIRELEEEVKLLKNLSHPNIVRYLGTAREKDSLNILLEFVPGGSISSLLGKFGSFPESVIRMYTKQLLLGLEYLHRHGIMHRDIKGANILVDNKGCIKLADFGASKKVVELATINGAKSMKGTPYWMAPEVIVQTGHSFPADIWSVGCTMIEMATGKPPWSQQYQEVAALFHIGTTKSHPPIPEHLSVEAKDFLLKCLQKEPNLRPTAAELLQHPFVTGDYQVPQAVFRNSVIVSKDLGNAVPSTRMSVRNSMNKVIRRSISVGLKDVCEMDSLRLSTAYADNFSHRDSCWRTANCDDDLCQIDDNEDFLVTSSNKFSSVLASTDLNKSFNPMCEPTDDWLCESYRRSAMNEVGTNMSSPQSIHEFASPEAASRKGENDFSFLGEPVTPEDDDEVTESKIRTFLDEKALELKKLQTPLYEEFYSTLKGMDPPKVVGTANNENIKNSPTLPHKSRSPKWLPTRRLSAVVAAAINEKPNNLSYKIERSSSIHNRALQEIQPPQTSELKELAVEVQPDTLTSSLSFSERQRKWKEELAEELERKREMLRQAGVGGKTSSPKNRILSRQKEQLRFVFPGK